MHTERANLHIQVTLDANRNYPIRLTNEMM